MILIATVAALIVPGGQRRRRCWATHWLVLAVVVALLALDEMTYGHQSVSSVLEGHFTFGGPLYFAWVIVYLPLALAACILLARFDEGLQSLAFYLAAALSDSLEMIGLAVLLLTVLGELARRVGEVTVAIRRAPV